MKSSDYTPFELAGQRVPSGEKQLLSGWNDDMTTARRAFLAWIGLVPKQNSSGGKDRLGNISKRGDRYLRSLFTTGALAVIRYAKIHGVLIAPSVIYLPGRHLARRFWSVTCDNTHRQDVLS